MHTSLRREVVEKKAQAGKRGEGCFKGIGVIPDLCVYKELSPVLLGAVITFVFT